jgi:diguanylate cyclase (GGDEF)-like protein
VATPVPGGIGRTARVLVSAHDVTAEAAQGAALIVANRLLKEMTTTDALTGISNRRGFDEAFAREWQRAKRSNSTISLLLFDIDEFKSYNDSHGRPTGDVCFRRIAACLRENVGRAGDFVARYGGEEFAVLLPDNAAGESGAMAVAERLRAAVESMAIPHRAGSSGMVTISGGVATARPRKSMNGLMEPFAASLVDEADAALYAGKLAGKNRVSASSLSAASPTNRRRRKVAPPPAGNSRVACQ